MTESLGSSPGLEFIRASCLCAKVVGSIPGHSTYKNQPMNA